jgi:tetratricopeptide (TPR) repeat protein
MSGIGYCHKAAGRYHEAIEGYMGALSIARRLGKNNAVGIAHGHLAACYMALGDGEAQREHGEKTIAHSETVRFSHMLGAFCAASAHIALGNIARANEIMARQDELLPGRVQPWVVQAWLLFKADLYWQLNKQDKSLDLAAAAIGGRFEETVLDRMNSGSAARWAVILCRFGRSSDATGRLLQQVRVSEATSLWEEGNRLSALLSVERDSDAAASLATRVEELRHLLPPLFAAHLQRFGLPTGT